MDDLRWHGDVSVFVLAIDGFDDLDQTNRRQVRQFVDRLIDEAIVQRQVCVKYRSWNSACVLLLGGDLRKPLRFLEALSDRLTKENKRREQPICLRCTIHCGDVIIEHDRDCLIAEGDPIQLGKLLLTIVVPEQIVSSGVYKRRATAFGTIPAGLFTRLPDVVDTKRERHEAWNVRQLPHYGVDVAPAPMRSDEETELPARHYGILC